MPNNSNKTAAAFWDVGRSQPRDLAFTPNDISAHLLQDWWPGAPPARGRSFMGWPSYIFQPGQATGPLTLNDRVRQTERQWKMMLSWMLGVAGTRHFLLNDGYPWIAPVSAFWWDTRRFVRVQAWNMRVRMPTFAASRGPKPRILAPDYIAAKVASNGALEIAVVESKGTPENLAARTESRKSWRDQAGNLTLHLNRAKAEPARCIVVATRVNPNAKKETSRAIQIRAWNRNDGTKQDLWPALTHIASKQLIGLLTNLRREEDVKLLLEAERRRAKADEDENTPNLFSQSPRPEDEADKPRRNVDEIGSAEDDLDPERGSIIPVDADGHNFEVFLSPDLVRLIRGLQESATTEQAGASVETADDSLRRWYNRESEGAKDSLTTVLPIGVIVRSKSPVTQAV